MCISTPHTDGLSRPRSCPPHEHKPRHPDAHGLPWHQHDSDLKDPPLSVSSKHVAETELPKCHVLRGVLEIFLQSDSFDASTRPTDPVNSTTTSEARQNCKSSMLHPHNTNSLTPFSNQVSNVTISRKAPSGNPTSKPICTVRKRQSTLQKSSSRPREVSKKKQQLI